MTSPRSRVGDILLKGKILDTLQLRSALAHQERWGGRLTHAVLELGLADEDEVVGALAKATGLQRIPLVGITKEPAAMSRIPVAFAESRAVFPIGLRDHGKVLLLAMADPTDLMVLDEAAAIARARIQAAVAGETEISRAIAKHYRNQDLPVTERRARSAVQRSQRVSSEQPAVTTPASSDELSGRELEFTAESLSASSTAKDMLEQMLAQSSAPEWTAEERERLASLTNNQRKSGQVVVALLELLVEKGYFAKSALDAWRRGEPLAPPRR